MSNKNTYTEADALRHVFNTVKPTNDSDTTEAQKKKTKAAYDKVKIYQKRYEKGELGQKAIQTLLANHGFTSHIEIYYTKD